MNVREAKSFDCSHSAHLYSGVEQSQSKQSAIGSDFDCQHIIRHLAGAGMPQAQDSLWLGSFLTFLPHLQALHAFLHPVGTGNFLKSSLRPAPEAV